jgi:hypothetical protein
MTWEAIMRKTGKLALLGAITTAVLLSGCGDDRGRSWAMMAQDDYIDNPTGAAANSGTGGSGSGSPAAMSIGAQGDEWLKQDFRAPYPPARLEALVAPQLGTGKPLRANAQGVWVQGTYAVELGSGVTNIVTNGSAPYQPAERPVGNFATPHSLPEHNSGN